MRSQHISHIFRAYFKFTPDRALRDGLLSAMTRGLANEQWATVNGVPSGFE